MWQCFAGVSTISWSLSLFYFFFFLPISFRTMQMIFSWVIMCGFPDLSGSLSWPPLFKVSVDSSPNWVLPWPQVLVLQRFVRCSDCKISRSILFWQAFVGLMEGEGGWDGVWGIQYNRKKANTSGCCCARPRVNVGLILCMYKCDYCLYKKLWILWITVI